MTLGPPIITDVIPARVTGLAVAGHASTMRTKNGFFTRICELIEPLEASQVDDI